MRKEELEKRYLDWMCSLVCDNKYTKKLSYKKLLHYLHKIEFTYILDMDGNRAEDGVDLRYQFGRDRGYDDRMIATYIDCDQCSILEMMIALSLRCESSIMENDNVGNRMGQWFWNMVVSLGLGKMTDNKFDIDYVNDVIGKLLNREYKPNGEGGLFTIRNCEYDLRTIDIWYQMCWYLDDICDE